MAALLWMDRGKQGAQKQHAARRTGFRWAACMVWIVMDHDPFTEESVT